MSDWRVGLPVIPECKNCFRVEREIIPINVSIPKHFSSLKVPLMFVLCVEEQKSVHW